MHDPISADMGTGARSTAQDDMQQWRAQLLNGLLLTTFLITGPYLAIFLLDITRTLPGSAGPIIAGFAAMYGLIGVTTFVRRLPYLVRTLSLLMILYGVAVFDIFIYGLGSDGRVYSLSLVVFAALLFGIRGAAIFAGLTVISLAAVGWLVHGWATATFAPEPNALFWVTQLTGQVVHSVILLVCIAYLLRRLVDALSASRAALHRAEVSAHEAQQQATALAAQTALLAEAQAKLQDLVASLETPAVDLADLIVLAPITGALDARRVQAITERLLKKVHAAGTRLVILDLAGIPDAEPASLSALTRATQALGLLGCRVVFTSVSATLSQRFIQAGVPERDLEFQRSPHQVLETRFAAELMG